MDYEPHEVMYTAGQPYVGATLNMYPAPREAGGHGGLGSFMAWDPVEGKVIWEIDEPFSVWERRADDRWRPRLLWHPRRHLKAVDQDIDEELWRFTTPSGIIGNSNTFVHDGKQYVAVLRGRRLGRHRSGGRPHQSGRRPGRRERVRRALRVHQPRRRADGVRVAGPVSPPAPPILLRHDPGRPCVTSYRKHALALGVLASALAILVGGALLDADKDSEAPTYTVIDGKADPGYGEWLHDLHGEMDALHGPDGLGSSFAPSLVGAAQRRTFAEFTQTVRDGRSLLPGRVMPGFAEDEHVLAQIDDIWRYLQARADGALGRGPAGSARGRGPASGRREIGAWRTGAPGRWRPVMMPP
jgi:hypothetical protein